jgi:hypothetical protein
MQFDLRIPIGLMFGIFGLILLGVGIFGGAGLYVQSLGINVNFWWSLVLIAFSGFMLITYLARRKAAPALT